MAGLDVPPAADVGLSAQDAGHVDAGIRWTVAHAAAGSPYVERMAKGARRTFIGQITWVARAELDELYARNDEQHRAIREAIAAGSASGARVLAREHVLSSWRLLEAILEYVRDRQVVEARSA